MLDQNINYETTHNPNHLSNKANRLRILGAIGATAVGSILGFSGEANAITPKTGIGTAITIESSANPNKISGPRTIEQLPGYKFKVSKQYQEMLKDITSKTLRREKGSIKPFDRWCTNYRFGNLAITAGHCLSQETGWLNGLSKQSYAKSAYNVGSISRFEYAVTDSEPGATNIPAPVEGISVYSAGSDFALMRIGESDSTNINSPLLTPSNLKIDISPKAKINLAFAQPQLGQQVYECGLPAANGGEKKVGLKGSYLGRIHWNDPTSKRLVEYDIVGLKTPNGRSNPTNPGGSGGGAITAKGEILGPLSINASSRDSKNSNSTAWHKYIIEQLRTQEGLVVDSKQFTDFAGHTVLNAQKIKDTINGFGVTFELN